jgi:hypothetical protein
MQIEDLFRTRKEVTTHLKMLKGKLAVVVPPCNQSYFGCGGRGWGFETSKGKVSKPLGLWLKQ